VQISDAAWKFLLATDDSQSQGQNKGQTVAQILESIEATLEDVRSLQQQQIILLTPQ
jgi:hypothetical protein